MAATVASLGDLAQELLDAAVTALDETGEGAPANRYITYFQPALDSQCDQLIVYCAGIGEAATRPTTPPEATGRRATRARANLASIHILAARCVHTGTTEGQSYTPPTPAEQTADALVVLQDGWALWNSIARQLQAGDLLDGTCSLLHFDGLQPLAGQGGLAGWVLPLRAQIDGYTLP